MKIFSKLKLDKDVPRIQKCQIQAK